MNAIDLLTQQHQEVSALFEKFEAADDGRTRRAIFDAIGARLAAHDAIEREIFYPAFKVAVGKGSEELGEALVEHGVVEFSIHKCVTADAEDLEHCVKVLKDIVEHHVEEEQKEMFPKARKAIASEELTALGEEMEQRFAEALEVDFREAVRANLAQVVGGAVETEPTGEGERTPARKSTKAKAKTTRKTAPAKRAAVSKRATTKRATAKRATTKRTPTKARTGAGKSSARGKGSAGRKTA